MALTQEQEEFATTRDTHILALASAGAGKTHTLIKFIQDKIEYGVKPKEIISFSFTRKAANELKERVENNFKGKDLDFKYISTIHSFCWNELIKKYHKEIGYSTIPTIIHELPEEFVDTEFKKVGKKKDRSQFNRELNKTISDDLQKEDFGEDETNRLLEYLIKNNLVMFDLMIHLANFLLEYESEKIVESMPDIKYVITDEAQDLNPAQYKFTKLLQSNFENDTGTYLVKVGDFKQSIYKFRGSDPKIINKFVEEFDPVVRIMSYNFRSAPEIVDLANEIAEQIDLGSEELNKSKFQKAHHTDLQGDIYYIDDVEDFIEELKLIEKPYEETCILARTNSVIKELAKILGRLEIPYYLHTDFDILKRSEVKYFMNLLSLYTHGYSKPIMLDLIKLAKGSIPLKVDSGITKCQSVSDIKKMFGDIKKIPEIVKSYQFIEKGDFHSAIQMIGSLLENKKKTRQQIIDSLNRFHADLKRVKNDENLDTWMEALEELLFEAQFLEQKTKGKVQLMTVHKAKGLQWDNVIFIYNFDILEAVEDDFYDIEEERRVVYTAVTRPKTTLSIWDIDRNDMTALFTRKNLMKMIEKGLARGHISKDDFPK